MQQQIVKQKEEVHKLENSQFSSLTVGEEEKKEEKIGVPMDPSFGLLNLERPSLNAGVIPI